MAHAQDKLETEWYLALSELYIPLKGGHIILLHENCRRIGNVRVVTSQINGSPEREIIEDVDIYRFNFSRYWFLRPESLVLYAKMFVRSAQMVFRNRPRAILAARVLPEGLITNMIGRWFGIASVVFAHGEEIHRQRKDSPGAQRRKGTAAIKRYMLWRTYRRANLIIANSGFTKKLLVQEGIETNKISVVHPGTDPERFKPEPKEKTLLSQLSLEGKRILLTIGRLTPRKGQDMTLRALPHIIKAIPNTVYLIIGTGDYESELRRLAKSLGVESNTYLLGEVQEKLLPQIYNLADVFVMPNREMPGSGDIEGFGIVFMEAGACEVPVVAGRSGGVLDAVVDGKTGILVDGGSPLAIAEAVIRLLGDTEYSLRLGQNARERICRELTWNHSARRIKMLIQKL